MGTPRLALLALLAACSYSALNQEQECDRPPRWFSDADGDGFGSDGETTRACAQPEGFSATHDDCNDDNREIHPGATELCDGADDDCNGLVDDSDGASTWYADADADGFGDPGAPIVSCFLPEGAVAWADDCDDAAASVHPDATEICDGIDQDCDGEIDEEAVDALDWYVDADGDGHGTTEVAATACAAPSGSSGLPDDCDDTDPMISPDVPERCDEIDNDCDLLIDEGEAVGSVTWYQDADGDLQGDPDVPQLACSTPAGFVASDEDCDDTDPAVNTSARELCDGIDNDCDGVVDTDAVDTTLLFADADGDGYGDGSTRSRLCAPVSGWTDVAGDCDDTDATVNPGATETWYDGVDSDCDGWDDDDADLDGYAADAMGGDDCDDTDAEVSPGEPEECTNGVDDDCDGTADGLPCVAQLDAWAYQITGEAWHDQLGVSVSGGGDSNGDGIADLLIGAYGEDSGGTTAGASYLFLGPITAAESAASAHAKILGRVAGALSGRPVTFAGDTDGDGLDDLLIGAATEANGAVSNTGAAYLLLSPVTGTIGLAAADFSIMGATGNAGMGNALVAAGDVDGDGFDDLLIGAPGTNFAPYGDVGAAVLLHGPMTGTISDLSDTWCQYLGAAVGDEAGYQVTGGGDLDGDGLPEVVIGAYAHNVGASADAGAAYVLGEPDAQEVVLSDAPVIIEGRAAGDRFARGLSSPGDLDGDGFGDLLVGAPYGDLASSNAGEVYLFLGPMSGWSSTADAAAIFTGSDTNEYLGDAIGQAGDFDGDGTPDLLLGSAYREGAAGTKAGAAYVDFGPFSGTVAAVDAGLTVEGPASGDQAGWSVSWASDMDGDGRDEVLVGALLDDTTASAAGAVWVLAGSSL